MKLAIVIITYDKVADVKLLMHSVRTHWSQEETLSKIDIYHIFNGKLDWYPQKTLEDFLIRTENTGHMTGAGHLIDLGVEAVNKSKISYDYLIVSSADVFFSKPREIVKILKNMEESKALIATSVWFHPLAYATEFFILKPAFAANIFPLELKSHLDSHAFARHRLKSLAVWPVLEELLYARVSEKLQTRFAQVWKKYVLLIPGRKYVSFHNRFSSPTIGYSSFHDQAKRQAELRRLKLNY